MDVNTALQEVPNRPHPRWLSTWNSRSCESFRQVRVSVSILWVVGTGAKLQPRKRDSWVLAQKF